MESTKGNRLIIIGASGHGKVVADIARLNGYTDIMFLDDDTSLKTCGDYPVVGITKEASSYDCDKFVAIGNCEIRKRFLEDVDAVTLIHPNAVISDDVEIGDGSVVMAGAVINTSTRIGKGCIVNTCSSVDHDCFVDDYVHVAVGAHLCGTVNVGCETWIGAGAIISNNIEICGNCVIGAGAVVVKNIDKSGTYVGVPALEKK